MQEPIEIMFDIVGVDLIFESFTIKGLANFFIDTLYNGEYKVERQDFRFILSSESIKVNEINEEGLEFNFIDKETAFRFYFKSSSIPEFDLTGLAEFKADYLYKEAL